MKFNHVVMAALLFGSGWSSNVVYQYQTGKNTFRGLASEAEKEVTIDNVRSHIAAMEERADKIAEVREEIKKSLEDKKLKDLVSTRDERLPRLKSLMENHNKDYKLFSKFMDEKITDQQEEKILEDIKNVGVIMDKVRGVELEVISGDLGKAISKALEAKAIAQSDLIDELSESICVQNRELSSLTTKIEDLLEKQEKVFAKVKDEEVEESEEEVTNQQLMVDPALLFQAMAQQYSMPALDFFAQPQAIGLQSESNPMGLDMNFLYMTSMLTQSNGFGPRSNITYAPVYNQQRTYNGMPMMHNEGSFIQDTVNNQQRPMAPLFPGFNFQRGDGLAGEYSLLR